MRFHVFGLLLIALISFASAYEVDDLHLQKVSSSLRGALNRRALNGDDCEDTPNAWMIWNRMSCAQIRKDNQCLDPDWAPYCQRTCGFCGDDSKDEIDQQGPVCGCEVDGEFFCNFDFGDSGNCEPCSAPRSRDDCYNSGLPDAGAEDCAKRCFDNSRSDGCEDNPSEWMIRNRMSCAQVRRDNQCADPDWAPYCLRTCGFCGDDKTGKRRLYGGSNNDEEFEIDNDFENDCEDRPNAWMIRNGMSCAQLRSENQCDNPDWAPYCQRTCGFCGDNSTGEINNDCQDNPSEWMIRYGMPCDQVRRDNQCADPDWAPYCLRTCGFCGDDKLRYE